MRTTFIIIACACMLFALLSVQQCSASTETDAKSANVVAEQRVIVCYVAVAEADKVGANVSTLLSTMNAAGMLLSRADLALQKGDFESAYNLAVQSKTMLDGVDAQADSLKNAAEHSNLVDFWVNIVGSSIGTIGVVVGSFMVWLWLKKRYKKTGEVVAD